METCQLVTSHDLSRTQFCFSTYHSMVVLIPSSTADDYDHYLFSRAKGEVPSPLEPVREQVMRVFEDPALLVLYSFEQELHLVE